MSEGRGIHIGLAKVNPASYGGNWDGASRCAHRDGEAMAALTAALPGFESVPLITAAATRAAVDRELRRAADELNAGDLLVLSYAGHGAELDDQPPGTAGAGDELLDQSWCLWDGFLVDDEIRRYLALFRAGVRVLVISDSCFSGSMISIAAHRAPPRWLAHGAVDATDDETLRVVAPAVVRMAYQARRGFYARARSLAHKEQGARAIVASVILLAACKENKITFEGHAHGRFTQALLDTWNGGAFRGTHQGFHAAIATLTRKQVPVLQLDGDVAGSGAFAAVTPFSLRAA
jgi:hypothetical protein